MIFLRFIKSSGNYCSDLAKGFNCPIIHINGDDPEVIFVSLF